MKKKSFVVIVLFTGVLSMMLTESCTKKNLEPLVCFTDDVQPILISHCTDAGCHNPIDLEEGIDLTTYEGTMKIVSKGKPALSKLMSVVKSGEMPPPNYPDLTQEELDIVEQWIALGAVNSSNCATGGCDTSVYTFQAGVVPILEQYCVGCHNSTTTNAPYDFTSWPGVNQAATDGTLMDALNHTGAAVPMPPNGMTMPDCKITIIEKWVNAGALNN